MLVDMYTTIYIIKMCLSCPKLTRRDNIKIKTSRTELRVKLRYKIQLFIILFYFFSVYYCFGLSIWTLCTFVYLALQLYIYILSSLVVNRSFYGRRHQEMRAHHVDLLEYVVIRTSHAPTMRYTWLAYNRIAIVIGIQIPGQDMMWNILFQ